MKAVLKFKSSGVDDTVSECGLDGFDAWDLKISNNSEEEGNKAIEDLLNVVKHSICDFH